MHLDMVKTICWMGQKGDLSDFGIVDVPDGLVRVFQELLSTGIFTHNPLYGL